MKLRLKQIRVGLVIFGLMLLSGWIGWKIGQSNKTSESFLVTVSRNQPEKHQQIDLGMFWQVWDKLAEVYLIKEDLNQQQMVWGAIRGMTAALGDPYTVFLAPKDNQETKDELEGTFEGVGIQLGYVDNNLAVIAPLEGMPAKKQGIRASDLILRIKDDNKGIDTDTRGMSLPEAVEIIRGPKKTEVTLTVLHQGETEPEEITIMRDTILIKSVEWELVGDNQDIVWLKLSRFGGRTEAEWQEAVETIIKSGAKGLILDIRNNPGGYLNGAVVFAEEFLGLNQVVVRQENAKGKKESYSVKRTGQLLDMPMVVLINQGSASSSEILAGALRDYERAELVGETSFGKGTIQEALELDQGAGLHVTTAKWLLPDGDWVNETEGIEPDVVVEDDPETEVDEQLEKAIETVKLLI